MNVLITGGAGFIGSNYVYTHLEKRPQDTLTVLDALTYAGHRENLAEAEEKGVRFVEGRIEDAALVNALFEKGQFESVVHFAAETHVDRSIQNARLFVLSNVLGTQTLLEAACQYGVKRFHHISTDEVYGDLGFGSTEAFTEERILHPSNPYSASKAGSDLLCLSYARTFGLPLTISRCSNNYGPFQSLENLIPLLINRALNDQLLPLYGTGKNIRDWLYVRDHCEAVLSILEKGKLGEIYNIGGDGEQENLAVAQMILKILGKSENLITFVEDRPGHDERYRMDYSKIERELGWRPSVSFEEGMRETVAWYTLSHSALSNRTDVPSHERSYTRWRNRFQARPAHQSHQQAPTSHL